MYKDICVYMYKHVHVWACKHPYTQHPVKNQEKFSMCLECSFKICPLQSNTHFTVNTWKLNVAGLEKERALTCFTTVTVPGAMVTTEATAAASWDSEPNSMICCRMFTAAGSSLSPYQKDSSHKIITGEQFWGCVNQTAQPWLAVLLV